MTRTSGEDEWEEVVCRHCEGAGCVFCEITGKVQVKKPARLCRHCGGDCCLYCGYTGWEDPRTKYE